MNIAVVSHDAGVSELLCALIVEHKKEVSWYIFAKPFSPMATICERNNLTYVPINDPQEQIRSINPDMLFFGTGWQDRVEDSYVHYCKVNGIPTVAFLDHWSSHLERFGYPEPGWEKNLGDFTAVHDEKALQQAIDLQLPNPVALPNYYLKNLLNSAKKCMVTPTNDLLFLSEPTDAAAFKLFKDSNYWGFTQYTAFNEILKNFKKFDCQELQIRLHPSEESSEKFEEILLNYPEIKFKIYNAKTKDLTHQLLSAKMIIGFDTMALYIAALLGKAIVSFLPSKSREFFLPLPKEWQLRTLTEMKPFHLRPIQIDIDDFGMDFALFIKTIYAKERNV